MKFNAKTPPAKLFKMIFKIKKRRKLKKKNQLS